MIKLYEHSQDPQSKVDEQYINLNNHVWVRFICGIGKWISNKKYQSLNLVVRPTHWCKDCHVLQDQIVDPLVSLFFSPLWNTNSILCVCRLWQIAKAQEATTGLEKYKSSHD